MKGLKRGWNDFYIRPFVCVTDAELFLRRNGIDAEEILKEAMARVMRWERKVKSEEGERRKVKSDKGQGK